MDVTVKNAVRRVLGGNRGVLLAYIFSLPSPPYTVSREVPESRARYVRSFYLFGRRMNSLRRLRTPEEPNGG